METVIFIKLVVNCVFLVMISVLLGYIIALRHAVEDLEKRLRG